MLHTGQTTDTLKVWKKCEQFKFHKQKTWTFRITCRNRNRLCVYSIVTPDVLWLPPSETIVNTETSSTHDRLQKLSIPRKPRARKRKSKSLVFGTFLIVVTASLFGGYRFLSGSDWFESSTEVRTAFVQVDSQSLLSANGYLESRRQAKVGAKVAGLTFL